MFFAFCFSAEAQQPVKIPRIGFLSPGGFPGNDFRYEAFQQGLRDLGYVVGKNIAIEYRNAEGITRSSSHTRQ
jgi:putative tryptophan/tyrosine transport system substrate-binding protein